MALHFERNDRYYYEAKASQGRGQIACAQPISVHVIVFRSHSLEQLQLGGPAVLVDNR